MGRLVAIWRWSRTTLKPNWNILRSSMLILSHLRMLGHFQQTHDETALDVTVGSEQAHMEDMFESEPLPQGASLVWAPYVARAHYHRQTTLRPGAFFG